MFNLFKRTKKYPPFETLGSFSKKDLYFVRTAQWMRLDNEMITVFDPHGPRMITMDPWPQTVFLHSDGQKTVAEFIHFVADKYTGTIPENLDKTIIGELLKLIDDYKIIQFSEQKRMPDEQFNKARRQGK